jgi:hypothetical protein
LPVDVALSNEMLSSLDREDRSQSSRSATFRFNE